MISFTTPPNFFVTPVWNIMSSQFTIHAFVPLRKQKKIVTLHAVFVQGLSHSKPHLSDIVLYSISNKVDLLLVYSQSVSQLECSWYIQYSHHRKHTFLFALSAALSYFSWSAYWPHSYPPIFLSYLWIIEQNKWAADKLLLATNDYKRDNQNYRIWNFIFGGAMIFTQETDKYDSLFTPSNHRRWFRRVCHSAVIKWSQFIWFIIPWNIPKINIYGLIRLKLKNETTKFNIKFTTFFCLALFTYSEQSIAQSERGHIFLVKYMCP